MAAPSVFRAGVEESVSVTLFNAKAETRVQVQLSVKGETVAHSHGTVFGEFGVYFPTHTTAKRRSRYCFDVRSDVIYTRDARGTGTVSACVDWITPVVYTDLRTLLCVLFQTKAPSK